MNKVKNDPQVNPPPPADSSMKQVDSFDSEQQNKFKKKELANRKTIDETAIKQISRTINNVLEQENASENIKNIFLSLTGVLHHLYLYKKDEQQPKTNQQSGPELLQKIADCIRSKSQTGSNSEKIKKSELDPIRFICVEALERLAQKENFEKVEKLIKHFDERPDKQSDFIFSSIFPPYRQKTEDSNPATTALMTLWKNFPLEWMDFEAGIIDSDKANFNIFRNKGNDSSKSNDPKLVVDVSKYGYRDEGSPMQVYQKSLSGIASFAAKKIINFVHGFLFWIKDKFQEIALNFSLDRKYNKLLDNISDGNVEIAWSYGTWMPAACIPEKGMTEYILKKKHIQNLSQEEFNAALYERYPDKLKLNWEGKSSIENPSQDEIKGLTEEAIIEAISGQKVEESNKFEFSNSLISISTMQEILRTLSTKEAGSLIPFTLTAKDKTGSNTDTFTALLTADKYGDIGSMGNGDKIKIGLTDGEDSDFICLQKVDESNVKLVLSQSTAKSVKGDRIITPSEPHSGSIVLYPNLAKDSSVS